MAAAMRTGAPLELTTRAESLDGIDTESDGSAETIAPIRDAYEELRSSAQEGLGAELRSAVDWRREADRERSRLASLRSVKGLHGVVLRLLDSATPWLVTVGTGVCVGLVASYIECVELVFCPAEARTA